MSSRLLRRQSLCAALASILAAASLSAKTPQPAPHPGARLMEINVIARGGEGAPLTGLQKEDFQVFDNGQPQKISEFSAQSRAALPATEPVSDDYFGNAPAPGTPSSVTIVLLDGLNAATNLQTGARQQGTGLFKEISGGGVGFYYLQNGLHVLGSYQPQPAAAKLVEGCAWCGWGFIPFDDMRRMDSEFYDDQAIRATFRAINYIADNLAALPGRKNLVWISSVFPEHLGYAQRTWTEDLLAAANNVDLAVYPVAQTQASDSRGLENLASLTGGRAFANPSDLEKAVLTAIRDSASTYRLAFYPTQQKSDNSLHTLRVTLAGHPDADLHYRTGYLDAPTDNPRLSAAAVADAVWSPLDANGIGLRAGIRQNDGTLDLNLSIDQAARNKRDIVMVQLDAHGKQTAGEADASRAPLYQHQLSLSPKSVAVRLIVRDPATGALGSLTVPVSPHSTIVNRSRDPSGPPQ